MSLLEMTYRHRCVCGGRGGGGGGALRAVGNVLTGDDLQTQCVWSVQYVLALINHSQGPMQCRLHSIISAYNIIGIIMSFETLTVTYPTICFVLTNIPTSLMHFDSLQLKLMAFLMPLYTRH